ncbi:hypothetical protein LTR78_008190 [Recurvomyces mirabilis]|uniref:NACHT domain-containing protein n=1 Tax=Recurvomyces mirabilis TaxID=574656 RepID=A0AAE0WJ33_9PEZI|nr:hypothetical protein LTR78_008190 [Recurvomyces mirabilis]KAK5150611.1 hypothetical protein LTS14_009894 [Recurvomyces mirabilis]
MKERIDMVGTARMRGTGDLIYTAEQVETSQWLSSSTETIRVLWLTGKPGYAEIKHKPVRLIVDGLDECHPELEENQAEFEKLFELLAQLPSGCKTLVVSRHNNFREQMLQRSIGDTLSRKNITENDTRDDPATYITSRLHDIAEDKED